MLDAGVRFIVEAVRVPGVRRVSLVGSITTSKRDPKDIDLLLAIDEGADVALIAQHARRMMGTLQGLNHGADCFLVDAENRYLGRTCWWKECRPGIRVACKALHCGRRPHLSDDLTVFRLRGDVASSPPVTLWPEVVRRIPLPPDVESAIERLEEMLRARRVRDAGGPGARLTKSDASV